MRPVAGRLVSGGVDEWLVLGARHGADAELEGVDEHPMRRPLIVQAALGAHREPASGDGRERRREGGSVRLCHGAIISCHEATEK